MVKRTATKWVRVKHFGMITRMHYPVFAYKWLSRVEGVRFNTLYGYIIKQLFNLIGIWPEYKVFNTFEQRDAFLEQQK